MLDKGHKTPDEEWSTFRHLNSYKSTRSVKTHLLLLRLMTLSLCMSPISSGKDSSLLECRNSTVADFQLPNCKVEKPETLWAMSRQTWLTDIHEPIDMLTSGGSWERKLWSAAKVRMLTHWPMEEGRASISLKLQSSSSIHARLKVWHQRIFNQGAFTADV